MIIYDRTIIQVAGIDPTSNLHLPFKKRKIIPFKPLQSFYIPIMSLQTPTSLIQCYFAWSFGPEMTSRSSRVSVKFHNFSHTPALFLLPLPRCESLARPPDRCMVMMRGNHNPETRVVRSCRHVLLYVFSYESAVYVDKKHWWRP